MKKSKLIRMVREVLLELEENNTSGNVGGFNTPFAFSKKPSKRAKETLTKQGYKEVSRPDRPTITTAFEYR